MFAKRETFRPSQLIRVDPYTTKCEMFVCPHFLASISRCRLISQDRELYFSRLRVKKARIRRRIQNDKIYNSRYYPSFSDILKNIHVIQGAFQNKRDFFKIAIYSGAIF